MVSASAQTLTTTLTFTREESRETMVKCIQRALSTQRHDDSVGEVDSRNILSIPVTCYPSKKVLGAMHGTTIELAKMSLISCDVVNFFGPRVRDKGDWC